MILYEAAVATNGYLEGQGARYDNLTDYEKDILKAVPHILESYHYIHRQKFVDQIRATGKKVFLDSGAFSAFNLGVTIDLPTYVDYIKTNADIIRKDDGIPMVASLDGIGSATESYENLKKMEALGVQPLPVYHAGEPEEYLDYYVANYPYVLLGGLVRMSVNQLMLWLDRMYDKHILGPNKKPRVKIHGFGLTSVPVMKRYPWYSVDSSTWLQNVSFGTLQTPDWGVISISEKSPDRHHIGRHYTTLSPMEKELVTAHITKYGFDPIRLSKIYESRAAYNIKAFWDIGIQITEQHHDGTFTAPRQELFE